MKRREWAETLHTHLRAHEGHRLHRRRRREYFPAFQSKWVHISVTHTPVFLLVHTHTRFPPSALRPIHRNRSSRHFAAVHSAIMYAFPPLRRPRTFVLQNGEPKTTPFCSKLFSWKPQRRRSDLAAAAECTLQCFVFFT